MNQDKINQLINYNWTTKGIKLLEPSMIELWKEFSEFVNLDAKAKQATNIYFNYTKQFANKQIYIETLQQKELNIVNNLDDIIFDQLSIIMMQVVNNYLNTTKIHSNILKVQKFFNFVWYGLYPVFFYKIFKILLDMKNDFFDGLIDDLSKILYNKIVDSNTLNLDRIYPNTKSLFIIVGNLLQGLNNA